MFPPSGCDTAAYQLREFVRTESGAGQRHKIADNWVAAGYLSIAVHSIDTLCRPSFQLGVAF